MEPFECTVPVRFSDLDTAGVVNNAVYATYLEEARVAFLRDRLGEPSFEETPFFVASLEIDYHRPIRVLDPVDVTVAVTDVGESSFTFAYEVRADDAVVAEAETVQVAVDAETGASKPIPDEWRERLTANE